MDCGIIFGVKSVAIFSTSCRTMIQIHQMIGLIHERLSRHVPLLLKYRIDVSLAPLRSLLHLSFFVVLLS